MPEKWAIGPEMELKGAGCRALVLGGTRVALFFTESGWRAIEDRCTHADVRLSDGWVEAGCVSCPWHGAQFDLVTGEALTGPASRPVRTFPVRVEGGTVWIEV